MPSSRIPPVNDNISTFGAAGFGRGYTSMATWESATDNNLVTATQSESLECYADAASFNQSVTLAGATTNTSYKRQVRSAASQGYNGIPGSGVVFSITSNASIFTLTEANAEVHNLSLKLVISSINDRFGVRCLGADSGVIGCLAYDSTNAGNGDTGGFSLEGTGGKLINSLANNIDVNGIMVANTTCVIYNCTVVANGSVGVLASSGTPIAINVLSTGNTGAEFSGTFSASSKNNASSDATAPGTNSRTNQTFTFVSEAGNDFHLDATDAGAKDFGFDQSAIYDDDVDGQVITTWSIGFDSIVSANVTVVPVFAGISPSAIDPISKLGSITYAVSESVITGTSLDPIIIHGSISVAPDIALIASDAVSPSVQFGAISIIPEIADTVTNAINPGIFQQSQSVAPGIANVVGDGVDPGLALSSLSMAPSVSEALGEALSPVVIQLSQSVEPVVADTLSAAIDPSIMQSSQLVEPGIADVVISSLDPDTSMGSVSVPFATADVEGSAVDGTIVQSSQIVVADVSVTAVIAIDPTVESGGNVTITPSTSEALTIAIDPINQLGSLSIGTTTADTLIIGIDPSVQTVGNLSIEPVIANVASEAQEPDTLFGSISFVAEASSLLGTVENPAIVMDSMQVVVGEAITDSSGVNPSVESGGNVFIEPSDASTLPESVDPSVHMGNTSVTPSVADVVTLPIDPGVDQGNLSISPSESELMALAFDPDISIGAITVSPELAASNMVAMSPTIVQPSIFIDTDIAISTLDGISPNIVESGFFVIPDDATSVMDSVDPLLVLSSLGVSPAISNLESTSIDPETSGGIVFAELEVIQFSSIIQRLVTESGKIRRLLNIVRIR